VIRPFFSYYGGKYRIALRYPAPRHGRIIEPFAGSAGYSMRYPHMDVTLIDLDENIVNVWRFLLGASSSEVLSLPDIPEGGTVDDLEVCDGAKALIGFWLNSGTSAPRKSPSAWMRSGIRPNCFWGQEARKLISSQLEHVRHWRIIHGSYEDAPDDDATWFVDPPYQRAGKHYRRGSRDIDFEHLSQWCRSRKGQVIVCENEGADWLPFERFHDAKANQSNNVGRKSSEVMWTTHKQLRIF
jgi:site-specific DNA-adenine methylase